MYITLLLMSTSLVDISLYNTHIHHLTYSYTQTKIALLQLPWCNRQLHQGLDN